MFLLKKGKAVYKRNDPHPRVMIRKRKVNGKTKISNAKLHQPKDENEARTVMIYFYPNPNPKSKVKKCGFYEEIRHDRRNCLKGSRQLKSWKASDDVFAKMEQRELEQTRRGQEQKENKKRKKQAYRSECTNARTLSLFAFIKSFSAIKARKGEKGNQIRRTKKSKSNICQINLLRKKSWDRYTSSLRSSSILSPSSSVIKSLFHHKNKKRKKKGKEV